jgi:hypothetical protein
MFILLESNFITAWKSIQQCAYNTTSYPRPSIFSKPSCFDQIATKEIKKSVKILGKYHKFMLEKKFSWGPEETYCTNISKKCKKRKTKFQTRCFGFFEKLFCFSESS